MGKSGIFLKDKYGNLVEITDGVSHKTFNAPAAVNPLMIGKEEAVGRCGITATQFDALVKEGIFPPRVKGTRTWQRKQLNQYLEIRKMVTDKVEPGYVYFMEMGDYIKIGWSVWPASRRNALQTSNPYDIIILGAFPGSQENEQAAHILFAHAKHRGEWFRKTPGLLAYIAWLKVAWRGDARIIKGELDNVVALPARGENAGNAQ